MPTNGCQKMDAKKWMPNNGVRRHLLASIIWRGGNGCVDVETHVFLAWCSGNRIKHLLFELFLQRFGASDALCDPQKYMNTYVFADIYRESVQDQVSEWL